MSDITIQPVCGQCGFVLYIDETNLIIEHPKTEICTLSENKYKLSIVSELLIQFLFKTICVNPIEQPQS